MDEKGFIWLGDYVAGRLTEEELRELRRWLDAGEGRVEEFARWVELVRMERVEGSVVDVERGWERWRKSDAGQGRKRRRLRWVSAAAVVALMVGSGVMWWTGNREGEEGIVVAESMQPGGVQAVLVLGDGRRVDLSEAGEQKVWEEGVMVASEGEGGLQYDCGAVDKEVSVYHKVEVPVGGEYHFKLEDGTRVWINSESEVGFHLPFEEGRREIFVKGEVYLDVARDEARPFVVHAAGVDVKVLGTRFNVCAYGDGRGVVTTLEQGSLVVENGEGSVLMKPDEQVVAGAQGEMVKRKVDARVFVAWKNGVFEFEAMSLAEIAERLERWYDVEFRFEGEGLERRCFTGMFERNGNLRDALEVMERTTNVRFDMAGEVVSVRKK